MSELTTSNFGYESPIYRIVGDISTQIIQDGENQIFQAIQKSNIVVDKPELIKALQYDRNQYDKGYSDGRASIVAELEKIKAELKELDVEPDGIHFWRANRHETINVVLHIIDNRISELKGE